MKIIKGCYYTKEHEWIKVEGEKAYVGITDYAQHSMGDIVYVELPETDDFFDEGDSFGVLESVKAAADIYMPIQGKIEGINEQLEDEPELLNKAPYENYLIVIKDFNTEELEDLMDDGEYKQFCDEIE